MKIWDVYVDNAKVAEHNSYKDVALSKAFWRIIFGKEVVVVER